MEKQLKFLVHSDCTWFKGDHPCRFWRPCMDCTEYRPIQRRVLIVMLIKLGDMLIASALPKALKMAKEGTHITWLVDRSCAEIVRMNPYVDSVLEYSWETILALETCKFDLILGFEREKAAAALVEKLSGGVKRGLAYGGQHNGLYPLCEKSQYFFRLNVWNEFRIQINQKSWTEFYFELAGLKYSGEPYELELSEDRRQKAYNLTCSIDGEQRPLLIFNLGGSLTIKIWPVERWIELIEITGSWGFGIVLTYGSAEKEMLEKIQGALSIKIAKKVIAPDTQDDIGTLAALYRLAVGVVTGDTLGMHLALWAKKRLVALFGPSSTAEVIPKEVKNVSVLRSGFTCSPCAHQVACGGVGGCMAEISVERVVNALKDQLGEDLLIPSGLSNIHS